ncbi:MAG: DNA ligase D [Telluria sp.]
MPDALKRYQSRRNFDLTPEPAEGGLPGKDGLSFVIQKHWATRLHYDFRLELDGTMKSWAVPKGPSYDSHDKRMAVQVEDHPISYAGFEGTIPPKQYGAGKVIIWDKGSWTPIGDPHEGYRKGKLKFEIHGHKLRGRWVLVRIKGHAGDKQVPWLLIKENDEYARPAQEFSVVDELPDSVAKLAMPKPARKSAAARPAAKAARSRKGALAMPEGVPKAALPEKFAPELATLVDAPPHDPDNWVFEVKFDGYRMLARIEQGEVRLVTRNANDWTGKLLPLREELLRMRLPDGWYDGEVVVHDEHGKPDFGLLQQAFDVARTDDIAFYLFDLPYCGGHDLRELALVERRAVLEQVLKKSRSDQVRFSAEFGDDPVQLVAAACKLGLEGVIGKRRDARYVSRRSPEWIKLTCGQRQEFVIGGYTDPKGSRQGIGALLLGTYDLDGVLRYAGKVGSGFNHASLKDIGARLEKLRSDDSPFPPRAVPGRQHHWVKPALVAEVSFSDWTSTGSVRHPVFQGLRDDKPARGIRREEPRHIEDIEKPASPAFAGLHGKLPASLKVTSPDRVVDPSTGITKLELIRYYALVGELMMEHLKRRPLTLVRAPSGIDAELVFQKHADVKKLPGMKQMDRKLDPANPPMLEVKGVEGILSVAQWNAIELHTQNATATRYQKPDRMVFDLDPGEGVAWPAIQEAAEVMHAFLDELGLPSFLKTSGGKGLHVVVPIKGEVGWDTVKAFSQAIVQHVAMTLPDRFAFKSGPKNRVGKIFIDYLRNGRGATTVCAWSARARPGMGISVPLSWDELSTVTSSTQWTVANVHTRLDRGNEPWAGYAKAAKGLTKAMKVLGFEA